MTINLPDKVLVLPDNTQWAITIVNGTAGRRRRRYEHAVRNRPAMLEVEVDRCTRGACNEAVHGALDAVRAEHNVRLRGFAVGKVDHRRTQESLGEVGAALVEVRGDKGL